MGLMTKFRHFRTYSRLYSAMKNISTDMDLEYLCNKSFFNEIEENIKMRKGVGNISNVVKLHEELLDSQNRGDEDKSRQLLKLLNHETKKIPNKTHPAVRDYGDEPKLIKFINEEPQFGDFKPYDFDEITRKLNVMRTNQLGPISGHRSYYFMDDLAQLEEALVKYTISYLLKRGFRLVSVPDILPKSIIESCGMVVTGKRTQIYSLDASHHNPELCLSGTAEMSLAGLLVNTHLREKDLPLKLVAVSRCYRAETSNVIEQRGIYRVHQFTKVEMFGVTTPDASEDMLEEFRSIEENIFSDLGLYMRVLDMPPHELGAPAYRKYDIEAWMPGRKMFGEISSCSNCTDYQSRRLGIKYITQKSSEELFTHTLNGTACAVPRMLIAILETNQQSNGKILIPSQLRKYMNNKEYITRTARIPFLKLTKLK